MPFQDGLAFGFPDLEIAVEAPMAAGDVGRGQFEGEGQAVEFFCEFFGALLILRGFGAVVFGAFEEVGGGIFDGEDIEFMALHGGRPVCAACGDEDTAVIQPWQERQHGGRGGFGVHVIEDKEPAGIRFEPVQDGGGFDGFFAGVAFREV